MTVIFHNPRCGTSRNGLALIREAGVEPRVVEYLTSPLSRDELAALAERAEGGARELLRAREPRAATLRLTGKDGTDAATLDAIAASPMQLNRPIVVTDKGVAACHPAEAVLALLG